MGERMKSFSDSGKEGEELNISPSTDYESVLARELANQLGLRCRDGDGTSILVLSILKEAHTDLNAPPEIQTTNTSKFAQLDVEDQSSQSSDGEDEKDVPNNLLRQLALEREKRQNEKVKSQAAKPSVAKATTSKKKKKTKKGKGKILKQQNIKRKRV